MSPFTGLESECISFIAMASLSSYYFSWGENDLLVSPNLADSKIASPTTLFVRYLLCPLFASAKHPHITQHAPYIIPTLRFKMTNTWYSYRFTKALLQRPMITNGWYPILRPRFYHVHQAALIQLGSCVGCTMLAIQVHPKNLSLDGHFRPYAVL